MKYIFPIYILSILLCTPTFYLSAQNIDNLYYCNDNYNLQEIVILDKNRFVGWNSINGTHYLYLFDEHRLVIDTLELGAANTFFLQHIMPLNDSVIYVDASNKKIILSVRNSFQLQQTFENLPDLDGYPFYLSDTLILFQKQTKKKGTTGYEIHMADQGEQPFILVPNLPQKALKARSGLLYNEFYLDQRRSRIYFPSETGSALIVYDFKKKERKILNLPEHDKTKENWYIYFDHVEGSLYAVLLRDSETNTIYHINSKDFSLSRVKETKNVPFRIISETLLYIVHEKKSKVNCFYFEPI